MSRGLLSVPIFTRKQDPAEWMAAIQATAMLSTLTADQTLVFAKEMLGPEIKALEAAEATPAANMAALQAWLVNLVNNDANGKRIAHQKLKKFVIGITMDFEKVRKEVTQLFRRAGINDQATQLQRLEEMLPEDLYWLVLPFRPNNTIQFFEALETIQIRKVGGTLNARYNYFPEAQEKSDTLQAKFESEAGAFGLAA